VSGKFDGKVVLISGGARGQGRSHAIEFASEGADIITFDVCERMHAQGAPAASEEDLAETVQLVESLGRKIIAGKVDARDHAGVHAFVNDAVESFGRIDVVVANAGINGPGVKVLETSIVDWQSVIDTNLTGVFNTVTAALPHMVAQGEGGAIILISSAIALRTMPHLAPYASAKHGLAGLMRTLALELGEHSIRVNTVHPTTVNTPLLINDEIMPLFRPDLENPTVEDAIPVLRELNVLPIPWVEPKDISKAVAFLASEDARYITGALIPVDAGMSLK
jgi:(+)-trans-carveol dehydrogenase